MKIIYFLLIIFFTFGASFADKKEGKSEIPSLPELITLENSIVQKYEAYQFHVNWIDEKPSVIIISQEINDLKGKKVKTAIIAMVEPKSLSIISTAINLFKSTLAGFNISKVVRSLPEKFDREENGEHLVRFDSFNSKGKLRSSELRNKENGTRVENLIFSNDGKPLTMTFYYKLKINQDFKPIVIGGFPTLSLEQVVEKFGPFDYSNADAVIDVCIKLLNNEKKNQGNGHD